MTNNQESLVQDFLDLQFRVVAQVHAHHVEFQIYDIEGFGVPGERPLFREAGADASTDLTDDHVRADRYAHGGVKWDGCSNWHFDEQERVMLHACARRDLVRIGEILARCWDWTASILPTWDEEVAQ